MAIKRTDSWTPPDPKAYQKFLDDMQKEANRRFGVDQEDSPVVRVYAVDRSREEYFHYQPVPRPIEESWWHPYGSGSWNNYYRDPVTKKMIQPIHTPEENEVREKVILENRSWIMRMLMLNQRTATEQLERFMAQIERSTIDAIEQPAKDRAARIKTLEELRDKWADVYKYYESKGYTVDREANTYTSNAAWRDQPKTFKIGERPADFDALMDELKRLKKFKLPKALSL